jgi:uncharacterized protein (DUF3084 family)
MRAEPLGSLLVSRGHITEEQLELALTEQKATGRPLGEIVVTRGFAPAPTVAQALATQHGGLLKTEYGFATGWGGQENSLARVPRPEPTPRNEEVEKLQASLEEHRTALEAWKQSHAKLEEKLAQAQRAAPAPAEPRLDDQDLRSSRPSARRRTSWRSATWRSPGSRRASSSAAARGAVDDPRLEQLEAELRPAICRSPSSKHDWSRRSSPPASRRLELEAAAARSVVGLEARLVEARSPRPQRVPARTRGELAARDLSVAELEARLVEAQQPAPAVDDPGSNSSSRSCGRDLSVAELEAQLAEAQAPAPVVDDSRLVELQAELSARELSVEQLREAADAHAAELAARTNEIAELEQRLTEAQQPAPPIDDPRLAELEAERVSMQAELAARDAAIEQLQASRAIVETERAELTRALASQVEQAATLRAEAMAVGASGSARVELEERLAVLEAEREGLRAELAARDASIEQLEASRATVEAGRAELERALAHEAEQAAALRVEVAAVGASAAQREEFEERLTALGAAAAERLTAAAYGVRVGSQRPRSAARCGVQSVPAHSKPRLARRDAEIAEIGRSRRSRRRLHRPRAGRSLGRCRVASPLLQGSGGCELVRRPGRRRAKARGVGTQIVARIASAPIPGGALPARTSSPDDADHRPSVPRWEWNPHPGLRA